MTVHRHLIVTVRDDGLADVAGVGPLGDVGALADRVDLGDRDSRRRAALLLAGTGAAESYVEAISQLEQAYFDARYVRVA